MMEDLLDKLQETNDRHKKLLLDEIVRLKAERDALKARIDKGVRVYAHHIDFQLYNCYECEGDERNAKHNATLIIDKDEKA